MAEMCIYMVIMWRPAHWTNIKGVFVFMFPSAGGRSVAVELFPSLVEAPSAHPRNQHFAIFARFHGK